MIYYDLGRFRIIKTIYPLQTDTTKIIWEFNCIYQCFYYFVLFNLSPSLSLSLSLSVSLSISVSVSLSLCLSVSRSLSLSLCLSLSLSVSLCLSLSPSLSKYLYLYFYITRKKSVYLYLYHTNTREADKNRFPRVERLNMAERFLALYIRFGDISRSPFLGYFLTGRRLIQ